MDKSYTLQQIAEAAGLPPERVRYVIDQRILPGDRKSGEMARRRPGRGVARIYTPFTAFGIACAAAMIGAGLRRRTVIRCFELLCSSTKPGSRRLDDIPLYQAFKKRDVAMIEVGDHINIRVHGSPDYVKRKLDLGWRQIATGAELNGYVPTVVVGINAAKLRACLA